MDLYETEVSLVYIVIFRSVNATLLYLASKLLLLLIIIIDNLLMLL